MIRILLIETATDVCSAAVTDGQKILAAGHIDQIRSQASQLAPMIHDVIGRAGLRTADLSAVAVSSGPGSYTGLRVGVSTAKGICFGADIPLIGIGTLSVIADGAIKTETVAGTPDELRKSTLIVPMIDARRMEVYTALYDTTGRRLTDTSAVVLTPDTFSTELEQYNRIVFTGDGAAKYEPLIPDGDRDKCVFMPSRPKAEDMVTAALEAWQKKRFEDTAYFEPFYLKELIADDPYRKIEAVLHGH